jgi:hypothetical protein
MASIEDSLSEIVKRYHADPSSNKLKSSEQAILSAVFFDGHAARANRLSTVEDFIDAIKKLFVDGSADKESIKKALNQHGYDESSFKIVDESKKNFKVSLDELFKVSIQRALSSKHNDSLQSRVIELQNIFITLKQRPSDENIQLMKQMPGYEYIEEYWLSAFAPRQPLNFELFDGDKLSNTGAQVLKDIFNKYDTQNKGQLNQAETTLFLIATSGWNTVLDADAVSFEDLRPIFEDKNRREDLTEGVRVHENYLKSADRISYNEVIGAYTSHAKSKHFKGVNAELNTTTNVVYLALNAFAKFDQHVIDEYVQFSGLKDLPALIAISECDTLSTLAQARDCLTLGLKYWQKPVLSEAPLVKAPFFKKLDQLLQKFVSDHKNELEESLLDEEYIKMLCTTESAPDLIARKSCHVFGGEKMTLGEVLLSDASIQEDHFFGQAFWHMNAKPLIKFFGLIHRRVGSFSATAIPMCVSLAKTSGIAILECLNGIVARELIDGLRASLEQKPLSCVLPYEFEANNIKSAADVNTTLAQYLEFKVGELTPYFNSCQMVQPHQNVGEIIWQDYNTLKQLGVDRKVLADKLAAIIALARYRQATQEWREMLKRNVQFKVSEAFLKSLKQLSTLVRQVLQVDPDKVEMGSEAFPYRVELRETRGHHEDPFHPSFAMQSYYLENDYVGGSSDVTIVNTKLEKAHKELSSVQLGDMLPYLIRVACFFEGPEVPYRVDPQRICSILELSKQ